MSARVGVSAVVNARAGALERVAANRGQRVGPYHQARSPGPGHEDEVPGDQSLFSGLQGVSDH